MGFFLALSGICSAHILILKRFLKEAFVELFYRQYWGLTPERKILNHCWKSPGSSANPQAFVTKMYLPCLLAFSWLLRSLQFFRHTWLFTDCIAGHKPNLSIDLNSPTTALFSLLHPYIYKELSDRELHYIEFISEKKVWFHPSKWKSSLTCPVKAKRNQPNWAWKFGVWKHWSQNPLTALK